MYSEEDDDAINAALRRMSSYSPNPRDAALGERWRDEEEKTLGQLEGAGDYDIGKLLRDVLPGAVGITADALTNDGRGIGDISQLMMAQADQNITRDTQRQASNREYALKQRAQRESNQGMGFDRDYKLANMLSEQQRIKLAQGNYGLRGESTAQGRERLDLAKDKHSYDYNPEDSRAMSLVDDLIAGGMDPRARGLPTQALTDRRVVTDKEVDHAWNNITAGDKAVETAATTDARERTELKHAPAKAAAAADQTSQTTAARINTEGALAPVSAATKATETAASTGARLGTEGDVAEEGYLAPLARAELDPNRVRALARDPKLAKQARDELENSGELVSILDDMLDIRKKEAQGLAKPGSYRSFFDANRVRLEGKIALGNQMGVLNEGDRASVGSFLGQSQAGWLDLSGLLGGDVKLEQLQGVRDAFGNADRRQGQKWGYDAFGTAPAQTTPRSPRGASAPSSGESGMVTIRLGGESKQVTRDQAQRLKAINPSLEVL
jgi:hypothetical protein